jgi:hypothetical protein
MASVMARRSTAFRWFARRRRLRRCGRWDGKILRGEGDAKSFGEAGELIGLPTMPKSDRDGDRLRIAAHRQMAGTADEIREETLHVELVEQ